MQRSHTASSAGRAGLRAAARAGQHNIAQNVLQYGRSAQHAAPMEDFESGFAPLEILFLWPPIEL
jgi:hypothetical protein